MTTVFLSELNKFIIKHQWRCTYLVLVDNALFEHSVENGSVHHKCTHSVTFAIHLNNGHIFFDFFVKVDAKQSDQVFIRTKTILIKNKTHKHTKV